MVLAESVFLRRVGEVCLSVCSSLHWNISLPFYSFLYSGVYYNVFKLSVSDIYLSNLGTSTSRKKRNVASYVNCSKVNIACQLFNIQGWDSPRLKLCYLSHWLGVFQWKPLLVEKTMIVVVGESRPRYSNLLTFHRVLM